jgi:hypothetical protein
MRAIICNFGTFYAGFTVQATDDTWLKCEQDKVMQDAAASCQRANEPGTEVSLVTEEYTFSSLDERRLRVATGVANVDDEWDPAVVDDGLVNANI